MLVSGKKSLEKAKKGSYAVGQFNFVTMEVLQAIVQAASELKSPVIIATTEGAIKYAGYDYLYNLAKAAEKEHPEVPMILHLDHGKELKTVHECIKRGWKSIMYDGSSLPFEENVKNTTQVVKWCQWKDISVEAELGVLAGVEDLVSAKTSKFTDPIQAVDFVKKTKVHSLAIAIGTSHGAYKFKGESHIDIERLKEIKSKVTVPIVLHGASGVYKDQVKIATKYGAKLKGAEGVSDDNIKDAIQNGISKVNCDTDLRISYMTGIRKYLVEHPDDFDLRNFLGSGKQMTYDLVKRRIQLFGSAGKI
jgi:fructose-bisphosphate aldolase class II